MQQEELQSRFARLKRRQDVVFIGALMWSTALTIAHGIGFAEKTWFGNHSMFFVVAILPTLALVLGWSSFLRCPACGVRVQGPRVRQCPGCGGTLRQDSQS